MTLPSTAREHVRALWPRGALWPVAPFLGYALYCVARHDLRIDYLLVLGLVATLAYTGPRTKKFLLGIYPLGLVGLLYDGMRPLQNFGLSETRVHVCDLRALEARLFGAGGNTVHDFFYVHHSTALDLFGAVPYSTFILWCVAGAAYLYRKDYAAMKRFMWGFFVLNVAGFVTYHLLPAAPPWYYHSHGCTVDLATKASEGPALARVDALIGFDYFSGMYSKSSSVFGALPSLHCAYPLLLVIEGWRTFGPKLRAATILYYLAMVFSAVYLDHHWIIDAVLGSSYAIIVALVMRRITRPRDAPDALPHPIPRYE